MSHANGQCRFQDGTILHFEYNGTGDWSYPRLWPTSAEVHQHWRTDVNAEHECTCGQEPEVCEMGTDYGQGFYATGKACRKCMAIVVDALQFGEEEFDEKDGFPEWWQ